ncbi:carbohydrate ABC transporter permease [Cellulomonas alba]|uniref:Sugar ABC transporter permease n=1 Tax=Cellulomonas alba TaxID=3053467 RepID=A0ABT7SIA2_9CELL|nr:sugar ABC transporter permease [Cellulomonas alba]MDM7855913.1 sugar ABC transporter permease [Cellulomonas alba]
MAATAPSLPDRAPTPDGRRRRRPRFGVYALLVPASAVIAVALGYPLVRQFVISFQEYGLRQQFGAPAEWVGLKNYRELLTDSYVWTVIGRSIAFCLVNAALTMLIGVAFAVLMTRVTRGARITMQVAMLLAWGTPVLATMTVWQWLFDTKYGVINWVLSNVFGLHGMEGHSWIIDPTSFFFVATVIVVWMSVPFVAFSVYAGLTQVPGETLEAAEIDGASARQRFWNITMPMIRPVLSIVALLQVIWDLKVFTQIYTLQRAGAPTHDTNLLGTLIYSFARDFAKAGALATIMLVITLALTGFYIRHMLKEDEL